MAVGNLVKRLQDIMRKDAGINGDAQRIEQMVWMFFLKVYDAAEKDWELDDEDKGETFKSIIPEPLRWRNWAPSKDEEGKEKNDTLTGERFLKFVNDKLFAVLKGQNFGSKKDEDFIEGIKVTPETPRHQAVVYDVFEEVNQYMKNGVLLRQMINEIDAVNLLDSSESHAFGDMYGTLLKDLQAAGNAGEFYTPRPLTDFTVEHLAPKLGELMGDLAGGTGGFIISTLKYQEKQKKTAKDEALFQRSVMGQEWKPFPYLLGVTNIMLHGIKDPQFFHMDSHRQYHTTLIETTSANFHNGTVENVLREQLIKYGVPIKERTDEELYDMLVSRNRQLEKTVFTLLLSFITLMKANEKTIDGLLEETNHEEDGHLASLLERRNRYILTEIVKPFYEAYEEELAKNYEMDFTDAIIQATKICREGLWKEYDYILVDEFQDISVDRYKFLQVLRSDKPKTKLYCVGDDWQSIFRFAGSDMALFYEFEKYFGFTELCKIETTYRFHQPLIGESSKFVMKNPEQKEKSIHTPEGDMKHTYLYFMKCEDEDDSVLKKVEELVASLPADEDILLLGRYNYDARSVGFTGKIDNKDNRIKVKVAGRELFFLSVHSAKGLEADHVILVNCNQGAYGFPSLIEDDPILDFVLSRGESYPFAEERRLFYVAMTRAKKRMYILYDKKRPSPFISEFMLRLEVGSYICPKCLEGKVEAIKDGKSTNGTRYRSFTCSNNEAWCDFFETKYGDLTPPGILVTEDMTAQDVERMRENRRHAKRGPVINRKL